MDKKNVFVFDDRHEIFSLYSSQCAKCEHFVYRNYSCLAFPKGIPDDILSGNKTHDTVLKEQIGNTVFKKTTEFKLTL